MEYASYAYRLAPTHVRGENNVEVNKNSYIILSIYVTHGAPRYFAFWAKGQVVFFIWGIENLH